MWTLNSAEQIGDLARGAAVLGTGGGGDPHVGALLACQALTEHGPVEVAAPGEVTDEDLVVVVLALGTPTVAAERLPTGDEGRRAVDALADRLGRRPTHVMGIEGGGINAVVPAAIAARLGVPLVDADMMGRALPCLDMTVATLAGHPATPLALTATGSDVAVLDAAATNTDAEAWARDQALAGGGFVFLAAYPTSGSRLSQVIVPDTISLATSLGRAIRTARAEHRDPAVEVRALLMGEVLATGVITGVERRATEGFSTGTATLDTGGGEAVELAFRNEFLTAHREGHLLAAVPDLIIALETETGEPLTADALRYGTTATVLSAPGHHAFTTPAGRALLAPATHTPAP